MMEKESESYLVSEINLAAGFGAREIMQKIGTSSLGEKLLLRNDKFLDETWYEKYLVNRLEFFSLEENIAEAVEVLEGLFSSGIFDKEESSVEEENLKEPGMQGENGEGKESDTQKESGEEKESETQKESGKERESDTQKESEEEKESRELEIILYKAQECQWKGGDENPKISLRIRKSPFQIPFELEIIPYRGNSGRFPKKECKEHSQISYYMFAKEEYLSRSFYEIISHLEVINNLSWYKEIYDILTNEIVEGRKVSQSFRELMIEDPIPSLECRLDSIRNYENYKYMKKKWKKQEEKGKGPYPKWNQMIQLLVKFYEPILNKIQEDEVFVGDWMPQIARYLD